MYLYPSSYFGFSVLVQQPLYLCYPVFYCIALKFPVRNNECLGKRLPVKSIDAGNLGAAEQILNQTADRSAEWYFLNGVIASRKGWYDEAASNLQAAVNMEPSNFEYRQHLNSLVGRGQQFQNNAMNRGYNRSNDDLCCQALQCYICADCCCDCI